MRRTLQTCGTLLTKLGLTGKQRRKRDRRNYLTRSLRMERLEDRQLLAITVDTSIDERDFNITTDGDVSLRDAILEATPGETINFASGLNGATITLDDALGEIAFSKSLTIDASMLDDGITIDAVENSRIFSITGSGTVTLVGLSFTGGNNTGSSGGGAIRSTAPLVIDDCQFLDNSAWEGGAIYLQHSGGQSSITGSFFQENDGGIGGLYAELSGGASLKKTHGALAA
jgi:hypothetical protein